MHSDSFQAVCIRAIQLIHNTFEGGEVAKVSPDDTWGTEGVNQNVSCHF